MTSTTSIAWTHHTVNFWWGCTKVSPACTHCYAADMGRRFGPRLFGQPVLWGPGKPRFQRLQQARAEALKIQKEAETCRISEGEAWRFSGTTQTVQRPETFRIMARRLSVPLKKLHHERDYREFTQAEWDALPPYCPRVFVNSMSDWLDDEVPIEWLAFLLETLYLCPSLDFQLLTKRPENFRWRVGNIHGQQMKAEGAAFWLHEWFHRESIPSNIWIGTTVENQEWAVKRIPHLLKIPAKIRFLSCEPLSGPINLDWALHRSKVSHVCPMCMFASNRDSETHCPNDGTKLGKDIAIDWVITAAGVPFFFKQWGEWIPQDQLEAALTAATESGTPVTPPRKGYRGQSLPSGTLMLRAGTATTGNLLDGHKWEQFPA